MVRHAPRRWYSLTVQSWLDLGPNYGSTRV